MRGSRRTALWATMAGVGWFKRRIMVRATKKAARLPGLPCRGESGLLGSGLRLFGLAGARLAELLEELVDPAAHVVDRLLGARVERVRFARGVQLEQGQL